MRYRRRTATPAYYYHLTEKDWGPLKTLKPTIQGKYRAEDEPKIPRICIAPSVPHCLLAIFGSLEKDLIHIYKTAQPIRPHYTYDVADSKLTKEKWALEPTSFIHEGYLDGRGLYDYLLESCRWDFMSTAGDEDQRRTFPYMEAYWGVLKHTLKYVA